MIAPDVVIGATLTAAGLPFLVIGVVAYVWRAGANATRYVVTAREVRRMRRAARRAARARRDAMLTREDLRGWAGDGSRLDRANGITL